MNAEIKALACELPATTGVPLSRWSCAELARELILRGVVAFIPSLPPGKARLMRVEHEYDRGGALAYLAAYDAHRARLFGRTEPATGIEPFGRLVEQVMTVEPYASAKRVFWVVDNGSSHRGRASVARLEGAWPTLRLIHLPVHASWLNEIVFSIIQRKVVTPNDFYDLDQITERLAAFERRYNNLAEPFDWRFTRDDLGRLLERIACHDPAAPPLPAAA